MKGGLRIYGSRGDGFRVAGSARRGHKLESLGSADLFNHLLGQSIPNIAIPSSAQSRTPSVSNSKPCVLPPLSNSWIISTIWLYIAPKRTPNIDC